MLRARSMIPGSLLIAGCAFAVVVNRPMVAQVPQKPTRPADVGQKPPVPADGPKSAEELTADREALVVKKLAKLIEAKPVVTAAVDDELRKLLTARYEAAAQLVEADLGSYYHRRKALHTLLSPAQLLRDAQLQLSDNSADHVPILEVCADLAKFGEVAWEASVRTGHGTDTDVALARYICLGAKIDLLREKQAGEEVTPRIQVGASGAAAFSSRQLSIYRISRNGHVPVINVAHVDAIEPCGAHEQTGPIPR